MLRRRLLTVIAIAVLAPATALASGKSEKKKVGGDSYVEIKTLVGTTVRPGGRRGVMTVDCGLDIPNPELRDRAESVQPRLRAAYAQIVQTYAAGLPSGAAPNADFIARSLQRQTDAILGKPGARLLLGAILVN